MHFAAVEAVPAPVAAILHLREEYRRSMNCQIVHDSFHARGFTQSYLLRMEGDIVGYGSVAGDPNPPREIVKEFYLVAPARSAALPLFRALVKTSGARWIEAQTNDPFLLLPLFDCADHVKVERILFSDGLTTSHAPPGAALCPVTDANRARIFPHTLEPVGDWAVEVGGEIVATGGLTFHYNPPYGDLYMETAPAHRRRGYGSYLVQELKRLCYEKGCIPAARCGTDNVPSRLTLLRAGMVPCAHIVRGRIVSA